MESEGILQKLSDGVFHRPDSLHSSNSKTENLSYLNSKVVSSVVAQWLTDLTSIRDLTRWVGDPALPWAVA